jgi:hypothetical protein
LVVDPLHPGWHKTVKEYFRKNFLALLKIALLKIALFIIALL